MESDETKDETVEGTATEIVDAPSESAPEDQPLVALVVTRDAAGNASVEPLAQGDVRVTEVDSIIVLGLKRWRQKAGLDVA